MFAGRWAIIQGLRCRTARSLERKSTKLHNLIVRRNLASDSEATFLYTIGTQSGSGVQLSNLTVEEQNAK
jgi:hypothetical protein